VNLLVHDCVPRPLKAGLAVEAHAFLPVPEGGVAGKAKGELLKLARDKFSVFIPSDKGVPHQQNVAGLRIAVPVPRAKSNRRVGGLPFAPAVLEALRDVMFGEVGWIENP